MIPQRHKNGVNLREAMIGQELTEMCRKIAFQWFFACHQGKTSCKLLRHQVASIPQFLLVGFSYKIF